MHITSHLKAQIYPHMYTGYIIIYLDVFLRVCSCALGKDENFFWTCNPTSPAGNHPGAL